MAIAAHQLARRIDPIPARAGVGLKPGHYDAILDTRPRVGWFEVHPENYMGAGGPPHHFLERIRDRYPLSLHGVGLSIGAARPLDTTHLARVAELVARYQPGLFSEHLAWSTHDDVFVNDLLPLPYTRRTLTHVAAHVDQVQSALRRPILIENPSTYVTFNTNEMTEIAFLTALVKKTGCGLLLDVNNVHVCAVNHGFDAAAYIDAFPVAHVSEIHLAGHAEIKHGTQARLLIDAHDRRVADEVWTLYARAIRRAGPIPTLIEWDNDVPAWAELFAQAQMADRLIEERRSNAGRTH